jgi:hypothetical protein
MLIREKRRVDSPVPRTCPCPSAVAWRWKRKSGLSALIGSALRTANSAARRMPGKPAFARGHRVRVVPVRSSLPPRKRSVEQTGQRMAFRRARPGGSETGKLPASPFPLRSPSGLPGGSRDRAAARNGAAAHRMRFPWRVRGDRATHLRGRGSSQPACPLLVTKNFSSPAHNSAVIAKAGWPQSTAPVDARRLRRSPSIFHPRSCEVNRGPRARPGGVSLST